ncbi:MAG: TIGR03936 family radical SAM-associated protein [Candidatus Omnitrophota bacterium]
MIKKSGEMVFFSQLDLSLVFERSLRRAQLPLYFTQGFRPHAKMSFSLALKLGVEGEEEVTFYFTEKIGSQELREKLEPQLPSGLTILEIKEQ